MNCTKQIISILLYKIPRSLRYFFLAILSFCSWLNPSAEATIFVTDTTSLQSAITTANGAPDTIEFSNSITLSGPLPAITATYAIEGGGFTLDASSSQRGFFVFGGNPTIQNLTVSNAKAQGGDGGGVTGTRGGTGGGGLGAGGGLYVGNSGQATVSSVSFSSCSAQGGSSPAVTGEASGCPGGGGGGLGGNGGDGLKASFYGGGGGGGFLVGNDGWDGSDATGGAGGLNGGGHGGGSGGNAEAGTYGGGGGGGRAGKVVAHSSAGGYGGGGGAGGSRQNGNHIGRDGGFGAGGGGGTREGSGGTGGFGGENGEDGPFGTGGQGGAGAGFGGAIFVDDTSSLTVITSSNPFSGNSVVAGSAGAQALGTDIFLASGGNLIVEISSGSIAFSNAIQADNLLSTGGVTKNGSGELILSGTNTYFGTTLVNAGTLCVNGSISNSTVSVTGGILKGSGSMGFTTLNGGTISGTGTYSGLTIASGTIAPGASIGTINVTGDYTQNAGAIYEVEIQGTDSDKIIATGSAIIDTGAILTVIPLGSTFPRGTTYDILTASGGINQLWSVTNFPNNFSFNLDLVNGNTIARLTLLSTVLFYGRSIDPGNPSAVNSYLDDLNIQSGTDLATIANATDTLNDRELNAALNQLHPALFGAFELTNLDNNALVTSVLARQMIQLPCSQRACFCEKRCPSPDKKNILWVSPFGNFADIGQYQQLRGFDTESGGIVLGYDRCIPNNFLVGAGIGYMYTSLDWDDKAGDTNIQKAFGAIYGGYSIEHLTLEASVMGGSNFYNVKRKIHFATIDRTAKNHHNGYFVTPHVGIVAEAYSRKENISFFGNLDYFYLYQPKYTEKGANSLNLQVDTKNSHMLRSEIGGKLDKDFGFNGKCIRPFVALSWVNKALLSNDRYKAQFANSTSVSNILVVEAFKKNKNFISPEAGILFTKNSYTFSIIYKGEFASSYQVNKFNVKIQWAF